MSHFEVAFKLPLPADRVWQYVSWTGVERLASGNFFGKVIFDGQANKPGSIRITQLKGESFLKERLEKISEADFYYTYSLVDSGPLPLTNYLGYVRVTPAEGDRSCGLAFGHSATMMGVSEEEWRRQWLEIEKGVADFIVESEVQ